METRMLKKKLVVAIGAALFSSATYSLALENISSTPVREAFYGDLHLHTNYSFDAYVLFGAKADPNDAYKFARGEAVDYLGEKVKRHEPLDFLAVTDHSENIGVFNTLEDPNSQLSQSDFGKAIQDDKERTKTFLKLVGSLRKGGGGIPGVDSKALSESAWQREITAANDHYQPGKFTTFVAYEWTAMPDGQNLHRNVIFKGDKAPNPFTAIDSDKPEDLWNFLEKSRKEGYEALAIPHNSNASNGLLFDWLDSNGRPIDQAYAELRASNEPLAEISQNKGSSETHPALSPSDEFAKFEFYDHLLVNPDKKSKPEGSYVRDALGRGLAIAKRTNGVNPFKYGVVGATDFHNGLTTSAENAFVGTFGGIDPSKNIPNVEDFQNRLKSLLPPGPNPNTINTSFLENGSGNLTGIWAEQNTRESLYDGLRRKETFATSGTRLKFRFFSGWEFDKNILKDKDWIKNAYANGVPMGGDLPQKPANAKAPKFVVWGQKDPNGANLDRLQIVKVWLHEGKQVEKIFDIALSDKRKVDSKTGLAPAVGNTVNLATATYENSIGATELASVWSDPEFNPTQPAAYYLRVLEIPTPRWSTILAVKQGKPLSDLVPATIQERGWSSPIWYTPAKI